MKLMWLGYLVYSLGNCAMKLCIETGLRSKALVPRKVVKYLHTPTIYDYNW
jgi:hypothetical protein